MIGNKKLFVNMNCWIMFLSLVVAISFMPKTLADEASPPLSQEALLETLKEGWRLIDPASQAANYLHDTLNEIVIARFKNKKLNENSIKFYIADIPGVKNALVVLHGSLKIIIITKDLLLGLNTVDKAAFVIAHELTHVLLNTPAVGKTEEYACDLNAIKMMAEAEPAFNLDAAIEVSEEMFTPKTITRLPNLGKTVVEILDVHGVGEIRVAEIRNAATVFEQSRGMKTFIPRTPWPQKFMETLSPLRHTSYVDYYLQAKSFQSADTSDKLRIMIELIAQIDDYQLHARSSDALKYLAGISGVDLKNLEHKSLFDDLVNTALKNKHINREVYYWTILKIGRVVGRQPFGIFKTAEKLVAQFIQAPTAQAAHKHGQELQEFIYNNPIFSMQDPAFLKQIKFSQNASFEFPDEDKLRFKKSEGVYYTRIDGSWQPVEMPWSHFLAWAERYPEIADALWDIGVRDWRLFSLMSLEYRYDIIRSEESFFYPNRGHRPQLFFGPTLGRTEKVVLNFSYWHNEYLIKAESDSYAINEDGYLAIQDKAQFKHFFVATLSVQAQTYNDVQEIKETKQQRNMIQTLSSAMGNTKDKFGSVAKRLGIILTMHDLKYQDPSTLMDRRVKDYLQANALAINSWDDKNQRDDQYAEEIHAFLAKCASLVKLHGPTSTIGKKIKSVIQAHASLNQFIRHPASAFILQDASGLFSLTEKAEVLSIIDEHIQSDDEVKASFLDRIRKTLDYKQPQNTNDLATVIAQLDDISHEYIKTVIEYEIAWLIKEQPKSNINLEILPRILNSSSRIIHGKSILDIFIDHIETSTYWQSESIDKKIDAYLSLSRGGLFANDLKFKHQILDKILNEIQLTSDIQSRSVFAARLLSEKIVDPNLRRIAIETLVDSFHKQVGLDNDTAIYAKRFRAIWNTFEKFINLSDRIAVINGVAKRVLAQKKLAYFLRDQILLRHTSQNMRSFDSSIRVVESIASVTSLSSGTRNIIFEFVFSPLTPQSIGIFLHGAGNLKAEEEIVEMLFFDFSQYGYQASEDEMDQQLDDIKKGKDRHALHNWASLYHRNFWAMPFELRTLMVERLLSAGDSEERFQKALELITDKIFPEGSQYSSEAREILRAYLGVLKIGHKSLFLSALMATNEQSRENDSSAGEKLAMILELMGPAETKLGQQINSFPETPENIRKPVGRLKTHAREPLRWEIFELIESTLPDSEQKNIRRVGRVLGSASYYITVEYEAKGRKKEALSILRPWARERADRGFENLLKFLEQFKGDPALRETIMDLTQEAQNNAALETGHEAAKQQFDNAASIYNGKEITLENQQTNIRRKIHFQFVDLKAAAPGYRRMSLADGVHFSELPQNTETERAIRRDVARATMFMEFYAILRGFQFDHDRHGGQMRVVVREDGSVNLGLFDAGSMRLHPPTPAMREALGRLWFSCILEVYMSGGQGDLGRIILAKRKDFSADLRKNFNAEDAQELDHYLIATEKSLLTLGEYIQEIESERRREELIAIIKTLLAEDLIHEDIMRGFDTKGSATMGIAFYKQIMLQFKTMGECDKVFLLKNF